MHIDNVKVLSNKQVVGQIYKLIFESDTIANSAVPGQFVHIRCSGSTDPLLRRPFSINNVDGKLVSIIYQVKGAGTRYMSRATGLLDVMGPLGNGFTTSKGSKCLVVAGGIGIAPMNFLIRRLIEQKNTVTLLYGCFTQDLLALAEDTSQICDETYYATDDGSAGTKGLVTDLDIDYSAYDIIYSCGPEGMLDLVSKKALLSEVRCEVSLERHMACGIGACLGCVCSLKEGHSESNYSRVCLDGPVYDSRVIDW